MKLTLVPSLIWREKQTMKYPKLAIQSNRTNFELGLGRGATKAVFVSLLSLIFVYLIPQNAAAQSMGVNISELRPLDRTEATPGQYIILANHPAERKICKRHSPKNARRTGKNPEACLAAIKSSFVAYACGEVNNPDPDQLKIARERGIAFRDACGCPNFCPHDPGEEGPEGGLWK
jgi:hypothetical protein